MPLIPWLDEDELKPVRDVITGHEQRRGTSILAVAAA